MISSENEFRLYVFMKTSLASMTPGRIAAQANHAGSRFNSYMIRKKPKNIFSEFTKWEKSTKQNFGTTIILDGGNLKYLEEEIKNHFNVGIKMYNIPHYFEMINDPTYCFMDGKEFILTPQDTCGILFCSVEHFLDFNIWMDDLTPRKRYKLL